MSTIAQSHLNKARDDKFLLVFDVPPILRQISKKFSRSNSTILPDTVQFSIYGTTVPEITVKGEEIRFAGNTLYVSTHSKDSYPPVTVNFKVDSEYNNYWTIYQWLNLMHSEYKGVYNEAGLQLPGESTFSDYQTDISIYGLDEFNKKKIKFTYTRAFPTTIQGLTYDQQNSEEIVSGFTFLFSQLWTDLINFDN